jgi:urease accessory protein
VDALLLLLLDSRAPSGGHNHSAGMEAAIATGMVSTLADVERFCRLRLLTTGRVAAGFAATACALTQTGLNGPSAEAAWAELDVEFDARTPSAAARAASRQLGRGLRRLGLTMLPGLAEVAADWGGCGSPAPHHPLVLGATVAVGGGDPGLAGSAAALATIAAPASAAVRLLGLDPFATQAMLAELTANYAAVDTELDPSRLPADAAPVLDVLPDVHLTAEVRLFAS